MTTTAEPTETLTTPETEAAVEPHSSALVPVISWPTGQELADLTTLVKLIADAHVLPPALRKNNPDIALVMLAGRELRIGPMAAVRHIAIVEGKPSQSAELMAALVLRDGHKIKLVETSATSATVKGRRKDEDDWTSMSFTFAEAKTAGVVKDKSGWERYPAAMLRARAVSALCRVVFPDVLLGVSYTPEELGADVDEHGDVIDVEGTTVQQPTPATQPSNENIDPAWLVPPTLAAAFDHEQEHADLKFLILGMALNGIAEDTSWGPNQIRSMLTRLFNDMAKAGLWTKGALLGALRKAGAPELNGTPAWWPDTAMDQLRTFTVAALAAAELLLDWDPEAWADTIYNPPPEDAVEPVSGPVTDAPVSEPDSAVEPATPQEATYGPDEEPF